MPKKKAPRLGKQLNVRVPEPMYERVEKCAIRLGIDSSDLIRMMLVERLSDYEERAAKAEQATAAATQPMQHPPQKS